MREKGEELQRKGTEKIGETRHTEREKKRKDKKLIGNDRKGGNKKL